MGRVIEARALKRTARLGYLVLGICSLLNCSPFLLFL